MKKLYEEPLFEVSRFSFEDVLADQLDVSDPEGELGTDGGIEAPDGDDDIWG